MVLCILCVTLPAINSVCVCLCPGVKVRRNAEALHSPPPIFSLYCSPTWIEMLSINCMLISQWMYGAFRSHNWNWSQWRFRELLILLTYKKVNLADGWSNFHHLHNMSVFKLFMFTVEKNFALNKGTCGPNLP